MIKACGDMLKLSEQPEGENRSFWFRETVEAGGLTCQLVDRWRRQPQTADAFCDPLLPGCPVKSVGKMLGE